MARGDHIRVRRPGGYWHHGIDCGDGTVIHYTGEPIEKLDARIRRTPLEGFLRGGRLRTVKYRSASDPETVVQRAQSRLGEGMYHLVSNNCEHFAHWCKTGLSESGQVRKVIRTAGRVALGVGTFAAGVVLFRLGKRRMMRL